MLTLSIDGLDALRTRLDAYPAALASELAAKAQELARALADKVKYEKLAGEALESRSGALAASIAAEVSGDGEDVAATVGSFGDVKYAAIQEYGGKTGAHEILPGKASVLAFVADGAMHFARRVEHPGSLIPERSYLRSSLDEMSAEIVAALAAVGKRKLGAEMSREAAFSALFATVSGAYSWGLASRRMKLWSEVPSAFRPAFFQLESGPETYQWGSPATPRRTFEAKLFLYFDARDPLTPGTTAINNALDAIDTALTPSGLDLATGRQTLGGIVHDCKINGVPVRDTGDLDGDGLAVVSVRLVAA